MGLISEHDGWSTAHDDSQRFGQQLPHAKQVGVHEHSSALSRSVLRMHVSVNGNAVERLYRGLGTHWLLALGADAALVAYVVCNARFRRRVQSP